MTVVCYNHREEIESAISFHDNRLVIYETYGNDDGATVLWHPDWQDSEDGKDFADNAHKIGLDLCSYYESEAQADFDANQHVLKRTIAGNSQDFSDHEGLLAELEWHSIKLLSAGYVSFHQFSHRLIAIATAAIGKTRIDTEGGKATFCFLVEKLTHLYIQAALSEDLDDTITRMCDSLSVIRSSKIPSPDQHEDVKPSWSGILFDECPVTRNWSAE